MTKKKNTQTPQQKRVQRIEEILGVSEGEIVVNGNTIELPSPVPQFLAVELDSDGDELWVYFEDSLAEIGSTLESSDTDGVELERVYDLDTEKAFNPDWKVAGFTDYVEN